MNIKQKLGLASLVSILAIGCKENLEAERESVKLTAALGGWTEVIITDLQKTQYEDGTTYTYYLSGISPENKNKIPKKYDPALVVCSPNAYLCNLK